MTTAARQPPKYLRWLLLAGLLLILGLVALIPDVRDFAVRGYQAMSSHDPRVTKAFVQGLGWAGPFALIFTYVVQAVIPFLPSLIVTAVTVRAYGAFAGFFIVYVGLMLGAAAGYGLGKLLGDSLVRALAGERARDQAYALAEKHGLRGVMLVRMMPILPAEAISLVAGAVHMGFRPFMLATAIGILPVTVLVVWLSGSIHRLALGLGVLSVGVGVVALTRLVVARRQAVVAARRAELPAVSSSKLPESQP